jgi:hypothetical protein
MSRCVIRGGSHGHQAETAARGSLGIRSRSSAGSDCVRPGGERRSSQLSAGVVGFDYGGSTAAAAFEARAIGPAALDEKHQPAKGSLHVEIQNGLAFTASVEHIHAPSATEVHFGGPITKSNDPSLVGKFVHCVAIDGSPDQFSLTITGTDVHEHGAPAPILWGKIKVRT